MRFHRLQHGIGYAHEMGYRGDPADQRILWGTETPDPDRGCETIGSVASGFLSKCPGRDSNPYALSAADFCGECLSEIFPESGNIHSRTIPAP